MKQLIFLLFVAIPFYVVSQETTTLKDELYKAIEENNLSDVKKIVENGYDINQVFILEFDYMFHGFTPLLAACDMKNEEMANYLIQKGANINVKPNLLSSKVYLNLYPIDLAIINHMQSTIDLLLENNVELNHLMPNDCEFEGLTPLQAALLRCDYDLAKKLIINGADVSIKASKESEYSKTTALHLMGWCYYPDLELTSTLLKKGAKINCSDNLGNTPLHIAVEYGASVSYVSFLLDNGANNKLKNKEKQTALDIAKDKNCTELIELLKTKQ